MPDKNAEHFNELRVLNLRPYCSREVLDLPPVPFFPHMKVLFSTGWTEQLGIYTLLTSEFLRWTKVVSVF